MKVIEYLMVTLVTFLILQEVYGHPQPLASNNSMISKPNADKKLDNQEEVSQKKEESNHETKDTIDKVADDILASQNAKVAIEKNSNGKKVANLQETQVINDITPEDKDAIAKNNEKTDQKDSNSIAQINDKENKIDVEEKKKDLKSSDIQADSTQGESESFKKLLELVHTIENAMKSEIELRKLDKATLDNLNERVENTRVQITDFIKVQNELKSKIDTPENIKGKSNVEPRFNIDGVAKVKIQGEENIIKNVKDSEQNHEESSSLFGFMVIGIILAVLFGLIYQRNLKKQRPYRHSDLEDDEIYKYYIGTKSK